VVRGALVVGGQVAFGSISASTSGQREVVPAAVTEEFAAHPRGDHLRPVHLRGRNRSTFVHPAAVR